jgi:hypothetical protein
MMDLDDNDPQNLKYLAAPVKKIEVSSLNFFTQTF